MNLNQEVKDLNELRKLLTEPNIYERFLKIEEEIELLSSSSHLGSRLNEAFEYCQKNNISFDSYIGPIIQRSIEYSIRTNKDKFIESIYPLLGEMIKKSINQSIKMAFNNFNIFVEKAFSAEFLKWKLESLWTGVPFSEIVYNRSFLYKIEHIFIIHKSSAQIISYCSLPDVLTKKSEFFFQVTNFSIQKIKDIFWNRSTEWADSLPFLKHLVYFFDSPYAVFCACSTNRIHQGELTNLQKLFDEVCTKNSVHLASLIPDPNVFLEASEALQDGLIMKPKKSEIKQASLKTKIILGALAASIILFISVKTYDFITDTIFIRKVKLMATTLRLKNNFLVTNINDDGKKQILIQGISSTPEKTMLSIQDMINSLNLDQSKISIDIHKATLLPLTDVLDLQQEYKRLVSILESLNLQGKNSLIDDSVVQNAATVMVNLKNLTEKLGSHFYVMIEYPPAHRWAANQVFISLQSKLRKCNVFQYHLAQTLMNPSLQKIRLRVVN